MINMLISISGCGGMLLSDPSCLRAFVATSFNTYAITPLRHYAITPLRHYAIAPLRHYAIALLSHKGTKYH